MPSALTAETFGGLLDRLDADRARAGGKYEDLRRTLIRFFEWRNAPFPEEHTDETLDRVARKIAESVEIRNLGGYCYEVARLVYLETLKGHFSKRSPLEENLVDRPPPDSSDEDQLYESRLMCLDGCLRALPSESRQLILDYHQEGAGARIDRRKALAERLGLQRDALANRAQRVRNRLEACVSSCLETKRAI